MRDWICVADVRLLLKEEGQAADLRLLGLSRAEVAGTECLGPRMAATSNWCDLDKGIEGGIAGHTRGRERPPAIEVDRIGGAPSRVLCFQGSQPSSPGWQRQGPSNRCCTGTVVFVRWMSSLKVRTVRHCPGSRSSGKAHIA